MHSEALNTGCDEGVLRGSGDGIEWSLDSDGILPISVETWPSWKPWRSPCESVKGLKIRGTTMIPNYEFRGLSNVHKLD